MKIATSRLGLTIAAISSALAVSAGLAGRAAATTVAWEGAGPSVNWSTATNWSTGSAPSGSVDVLTLPAVASSCAGWACTYGVDDLSGLTVGRLQLDASADYLVTPMSSADSLVITGGLRFGTSTPTTANRLLTTMTVPLTLGAAQSWSLTGVRGTPTQLTLGAVTGQTYPLRLELANGVMLEAPELDTGRLRIAGSGLVSLAGQSIEPADSVPVSPPPLVSAQGVTLAGGASLMFTSPGAVSGAITVARRSNSTLELGHGVAPDGTVVVGGNVTLRNTSTLQLWIDQPAVTAAAARRRRARPLRPRPSADYSQLTALGTVALNGATLNLSQGYTGTQVQCAALRGGQTYTLISATQLTGTFGGIANGQVVPLGVCDPSATGPSYAVVISYNTRARPQTVTATVVGPGQILDEVASALHVPVAAAQVYTVLRNGGYRTTFNAPAPGKLTLTWRTRVHGRLVTVATGSNVANRVGPRRVPIRLTAAGRRLLRRPAAATLTASASFTPTGQSTVSVSRKLSLS